MTRSRCPTGSWLIDGNRYHKDGWDLWLEAVRNRLPVTGTKREANKTVGYAVTAYEYTEDPQLLVVIKGLAHSLQSAPLEVQHSGPLWNPEWRRRAMPYDATLEDFVAAIYAPCPIGDTQPYDLAAMRYDATGDEAFLREHLPAIQRLRQHPREYLRMTRGRRDWLDLRAELASAATCRSPGARRMFDRSTSPSATPKVLS